MRNETRTGVLAWMAHAIAGVSLFVALFDSWARIEISGIVGNTTFLVQPTDLCMAYGEWLGSNGEGSRGSK